MRLLLFTALLLYACNNSSEKKHTITLPPGTVTHIVDGDTFDMADSTGHTIRIRPIGINADEIKDNNHGKKGPFAKAAKEPVPTFKLCNPKLAADS